MKNVYDWQVEERLNEMYKEREKKEENMRKRDIKNVYEWQTEEREMRQSQK